MKHQLELHTSENGGLDSSEGCIEQSECFKGMVGGNQQAYLVEWLNNMFPHLSLPLEASEEELRACLIDGTVLCSILYKLSPCSVQMGGSSEPHSVNVKRFLEAVDEMGLPGFEPSDLEKGSMVPVLQCLWTLRGHFNFNVEEENIQNHSGREWKLLEVDILEGIDCSQGDASSCGQQSVAWVEERQRSLSDSRFERVLRSPVMSEPAAAVNHVGHKFQDVFQLKQGCYSDLSDPKVSELMKSNTLDNAPTQSLFNIVNKILDESIERKNGDVPNCVACLLRKVVQVIERRISTQAENLRNQNILYKAREEKYQSRIRVLETLATGTAEENGVVMSQMQKIKIEKNKIEEEKKLEEQDVVKLMKEKDQGDTEILALKNELEMVNGTYKKHCLQLQTQAEETKVALEKKEKELERLLTDLRKKVEELEAFSESRSRRWKNKELTYQSFIDSQSGALQELRVASESIKQAVSKTQRSYSEEFKYFGMKLRGLADAAGKYHAVLAENRKLYNEVQDLKGNIRVYCRIRPFLSGQSGKQTTIDYIGDNGELVVMNSLKQGKDSHKAFKFNKVFGPAATQEEVFLDTRPLIRSVLDGYNVCIFAYGQTGSGKTYTMSGPDVSLKEDWGVNYRALNDLFHISQNRKSSIIYEIGVQMVEIYNEQVRDLLSTESSQKRLGICNTAQRNGLAVPDASMHFVKSTTDVLKLMSIGLMNRAVGATALNERSSRSHSVVTIHVRGTDVETDAVLRGSLHLIDLAGSERVDRSEVTGDRLREAQHINRSLSALGDVIFSLAQKSPHVPYRNSKLTQLLQSSLGGQAKTLMFVQLNPDVDSYSETISTLKFAERVSGVELGAARSNKEGKEVRELMDQVASLKETIAKKDEEIERLRPHKVSMNGEIERLRSLKVNTNSSEKQQRGMSSLRHESYSPRRHSAGASRSPRTPGEKRTGVIMKVASHMDISSEYDDKHNQGSSGSQHSSNDESRNQQKEISLQSKVSGADSRQKFNEDIDLLGFGDDSEERLSDISDSGLSMGTEETDGSMCSVVEFTLFPEAAKPAETNMKVLQKSPSAPSKLPRPPQKQLPRRSQSSLARGSTKVSSSISSKAASSSTRRTFSSTSTKPLKRWQ